MGGWVAICDADREVALTAYFGSHSPRLFGTEAVEKRVIWGGRRMIFLDRDGWNAH
jgi:hypothetical protein